MMNDIRFKPLPAAGQLKENLRDRVLMAFGEVLNAADARTALKALGRFGFSARCARDLSAPNRSIGSRSKSLLMRI
jgi:hypothetical protein